MEVDLTPVREILRLDGGDVELVGVDPDAGAVHLRLLLEDASCAECVLPGPMLEPIALNLLTRPTPGLRAVVIDDPRQTGGAPTAG